MLRYSAFIIAGVLGCSKPDTPPRPANTDLSDIIARFDGWQGYPGMVCWDGNANCNGNSGLFSGLLCSVGQPEACDHVAQLATEGGLLRHPDADPSAENSSSRDELLGHLLTITTTKDKEHAERVFAIVRDGKICNNSTDTRCSMTPMMWGLMRVTWNHIGLKPSWQMLASNVGDDHTLLVQAESAPTGFELHLIGVNLLLRAKTDTWSSTNTKVAATLAKRQPENEFFQYLAGNNKEAARLLRSHLPEVPTRQKQWYTERDTVGQEWKNAHNACFWFLAKLFSTK